MDKTLEKISKAKSQLLLRQPFFGLIALNLEYTEDNDFSTMWTDGKKLGYNVNFVEKLSITELQSIIAHEVMHVALLHHLRKGNRIHEIWNVACDYAINLILRESGFSLPHDVLISSKYIGWTAEAIYNDLQRIGGTKERDLQIEELEKSSKIQGEVRQLSGQNGQSLSEGELSRIETETKVIVNRAVIAAKTAGRLPSFLKELVEASHEQKIINWKEALSRFITQNCKDNYDWRYPNRRYLPQSVYLPGMIWNEKLGDIICALDSSGSLTKEELQSFASELQAILSTFNTGFKVITCDAKVQQVFEISQYDIPLKLNIEGRGGTKYSPVFDYIRNQNLSVVCVIYFTDGKCNDFGKDPQIPVLWVLKNRIRPWYPPFGETIYMER